MWLMSTSRRRKRSYHHGDLRAATLHAAAELLEKKGPDAVVLREVARLAGVSHNAPYRHFPSREALLAALAAEGRDLPGLPRFDLVAGTGDDAGYYAAAREFMAAWGRVPVAGLALLALGLALVAVAVVRLWHAPARRAWLVPAGATAVSLAVLVAVLQMEPSGAPVFGWSLVWAAPMLPYLALGLPLDYEIAFAFGFPLSLAANVVALVATAYAGWYATGRRVVGLGAAAALAIWPLTTALVAGESAWENGTWLVDTGLALYTEPLATALVATAAALLLAPANGVRVAAAGVLFSLATLVKLSNALAGALVLVLIALYRAPREAALFLAGCLTFAPVALAYWPLSYYVREEDRPENYPDTLFSLGYAADSWADSLLFSPRTLIVLLPLAVVGAVRFPRGYALWLLLALALVNPLFYTFYEPTAVHPRFLFASLPPFFVLWAVGLRETVAFLRGRVRSP